MSPQRLAECMDVIQWGVSSLAKALDCPEFLVSAWLAGKAKVPPDVAGWLEGLAAVNSSPVPREWKEVCTPRATTPDMKVPVFEALIWNTVAGQQILLDAELRTIDGIHRAGAQPLYSSERLVDVTDVDDDGVFRPKPR